MQLSNGARPGAPIALMGIMTLALVLLMVRSAGLYPAVLGDEYTYSTMSRLMPLSEAFIPGYLYLAIYKMTNLCGSGFLACSKLFNTLFFVASAPFIYGVSRRFCGPLVSLLIVAISLLGPINSYTAYYMPEPLFFLTFWICAWYFFSLNSEASPGKWLLFGFLMGCSALVKPHALLMIPGFCLCILFFAYKDSKQWFVRGVQNAALFVIAMLATKFVISFLIAGKSGLSLFGSFYTTTLESNTSTLQRYLDIFMMVPGIVEGHVLANTLMFGAALAIILFGSVKALATRTLVPDDRIATGALILLLNLVAVVGLFSASVAGTHAVETALRIHMRYYNFMLPLLFIAAGSQLGRVHGAEFKYWRLAATVLVLAILGYAALTAMQPFTPSYVDSPELRGYTLSRPIFMVLAGLSAVAVLLWYKSAHAGSVFFVCFYLPLSVAVTTAVNNAEVRVRMNDDAYDRAGLFAKSYLPSQELSKLAVIGGGDAFTLRTLIYLEDRNAIRDLSYTPGSRYSASQTPAERKWILAIGDVDFAEGEFEVMKLNGFSLAKKVSSLYPLQMDFRSPFWPDSINKVTGLSHTEAWGTWSVGSTVDVAFSRALPAQFDLALTAKAFGPNAGQSFDIEVEGQRYPVTLTDTNTTQVVRVTTSGHADRLSLRIPKPTSPQALGLSTDDRALGAGIESMEIRPVQ